MIEEISYDRRRFVGIAVMTIAAAPMGMVAWAKTRSSNVGELGSVGNATAWLNSRPLTASELRGKVVLIDFWTYSCINWRRQLPYVRAWAGQRAVV